MLLVFITLSVLSADRAGDYDITFIKRLISAAESGVVCLNTLSQCVAQLSCLDSLSIQRSFAPNRINLSPLILFALATRGVYYCHY